VTLAAKYSPGGINTFFKLDLKPCNELESVFKSRGKFLQTRGAATDKRRLPNIVLQLGTVNSSCDD